jgi:hypothetical protein
MLATLPDAELEPLPNAPAVTPLVRVPLDDEVALQWLLAPASTRYSAALPLAAHGALACLILHVGEDGIESLRPALESLAGLPRTRVLHALLHEAGDAISPAALSERLALFDESPLIVVPREPGAAATLALRELLVRLLP